MRLILADDMALGLSGGFWARRARVMERWRVEMVGAAQQRSVFTALGCFVEIISYTPRVFVPTDKTEVLAAVPKRWPVERLLPGRAAA